MTIPLLVATTNAGKKREYEALLQGLPFELIWPEHRADAAETGATFAENARLKAVAYARASGLWTLADDSGLEVDALGGEPGVFSARYGGPEASDRDRYQLLLCKLEGVPWEKRTARFRCVVALALPSSSYGQERVWLAEGVCEGVIAFEPRGTQGFGYDPVFYLPELGRTMAELPPELKNQISHRARAVQAMKELILHEVLADPSLRCSCEPSATPGE